MCRYICCIEVNVYAHACEGVGEEEDMENREILRRRAGRTRAGTRWVRLAGISKHDLSSSLLRAVPLSSFEIFFFLREIFLWNFCARSIRWPIDVCIPVLMLFIKRALNVSYWFWGLFCWNVSSTCFFLDWDLLAIIEDNLKALLSVIWWVGIFSFSDI